MQAPSQHLETHGYAVVASSLEHRAIDEIGAALDDAPLSGAGSRRMLDLEWCASLAGTLRMAPWLRRHLPTDAVAVQCTSFVKSPEQNWLVSIHQDLSIPVAERVDSSACSGWSDKEGDVFVQPPVRFLDDVLAVRLHLDDCDESNGALRVVPGSHKVGRVGSAEALQLRARLGEVVVPVPKGSAMLMRPLLLHASSKVVSSTPRRVLHFVFAPRSLPEGLRWRIAV